MCTLGVRDWHKWRQGSLGGNIAASPVVALDAVSSHLTIVGDRRQRGTVGDDSEILMAGNESGGNDFIQLPGSSLQEAEDGTVVRVGMERASLAAFGLPVNEDEASDWIQVDVLVGSDGSAQAVRLPE